MGLARFTFTKIMGWKMEGAFDPDLKKSVIIVVPHTSWFDFIIGLFARRLSGIRINYLGKKELFTWPFSYYFKWTGGTPLDRTPGQNKVEAIAQLFNDRKEFRLALAPEGTRKKVEKWRSGFYYIALEAKVPIITVAFDYGTKTVKIGAPMYPTGDIETDLKKLRTFFDGVVGKIPEKT